MGTQDVYIYTKKSEADCAYVFKSGRVYIELNNDEGFELEGQDMIFGTSEVILSREDNYAHYRMFSVKASKNSKYVKIKANVVLDIIGHYNIAFATAKTIANMLVNINNILSVKKSKIGEKEEIMRDYCKTYAHAIDSLATEYEAKRFPWLEEVIVKAKASLIYSKGHAFMLLSTAHPKLEIRSSDIDKFSRVYPPGSEICKQGDAGDDLYILKQGRLNVSIDGKDITVISERGSVIGEMALLLEERRTATISAVEESILVIVKKSNLKAFIDEHPRFLINIILDLSRRMEQNCAVLSEVVTLIEQDNEQDSNIPHALRENKYKTELQNLRNTIKALFEKYDMDWIEEILIDITDKILLLKR